MSKILALKLLTGEEIIGEYTILGNNRVQISNPVGITVIKGKNGMPNIGFSPFPLHAEQIKNSVQIFQKNHIVYTYTPQEEFISNYNKIFGSGLVIPTNQLLME